MKYLEVAACVVATVLADLRWLRVAQREHYLPGTVERFANRWWYGQPLNLVLYSLALAAFVVSARFRVASLVLAGIIAAGPVGLGIRGRTSKLAWTRRLKTLAATAGGLQLIFFAIGFAAGAPVFIACLVAALSHAIVDLALLIRAPFEQRTAKVFVAQAQKRLQSVGPKVVGITGSYGKTSTKNYVAHLLSGSKTVFATPASFNNRAGICRAINEQLSPGTDVFVAEMGTYGFGEIAELCTIAPPDVAAFTAVGPVHLERFGSEAAIIAAKSEIFQDAKVCVLNVDDERLDFLAGRLETDGKKVWRCGSSASEVEQQVHVAGGDGSFTVTVEGTEIARIENVEAAPTNIACAVAVALELGVTATDIAARLGSLPAVAHRQEVTRNPEGPTVIDDTYNANPASVRRGLQLLGRSATEGHRRVVATPGLVELGSRQFAENESFAREIGEVASDVIIIGRTNRKALLSGTSGGGVNVVTVDRLPQAVDWVRTNLGEGDAVLYANDLPDHFA